MDLENARLDAFLLDAVSFDAAPAPVGGRPQMPSPTPTDSGAENEDDDGWDNIDSINPADSSLDSLSMPHANADQEDPKTEEELMQNRVAEGIVIMIGPHRCIAPCGVTEELELNSSTTLSATLEAGTEVDILEVQVANGRKRGRTAHGWISFVNGNGAVLLRPMLGSSPVTAKGGIDPWAATGPGSPVSEHSLTDIRHASGMHDTSGTSATIAALAKIESVLSKDVSAATESTEPLGRALCFESTPASNPSSGSAAVTCSSRSEVSTGPESTPTSTVITNVSGSSSPGPAEPLSASESSVMTAAVTAISTLRTRSRLRRPGIKPAVARQAARYQLKTHTFVEALPARPQRGNRSTGRLNRVSARPAALVRDTHITDHVSVHGEKSNANWDYWGRTHKKIEKQKKTSADLDYLAENAVGQKFAGQAHSSGDGADTEGVTPLKVAKKRSRPPTRSRPPRPTSTAGKFAVAVRAISAVSAAKALAAASTREAVSSSTPSFSSVRGGIAAESLLPMSSKDKDEGVRDSLHTGSVGSNTQTQLAPLDSTALPTDVDTRHGKRILSEDCTHLDVAEKAEIALGKAKTAAEIQAALEPVLSTLPQHCGDVTVKEETKKMDASRPSSRFENNASIAVQIQRIFRGYLARRQKRVRAMYGIDEETAAIMFGVGIYLNGELARVGSEKRITGQSSLLETLDHHSPSSLDGRASSTGNAEKDSREGESNGLAVNTEHSGFAMHQQREDRATATESGRLHEVLDASSEDEIVSPPLSQYRNRHAHKTEAPTPSHVREDSDENEVEEAAAATTAKRSFNLSASDDENS
eukprot:SAG31_NODE_110_length_24476_cov_9.909654_13_plen_816_part_00